MSAGTSFRLQANYKKTSMNTLTRFFLSFVAAAAIAGSVPSQRDALNQQYLKVRPEYTAAVKSGNNQAFVASVASIQAFGQAIVAANAPAIAALRRGFYPPDVKSKQAQNTWDQKVDAAKASLLASNKSITGFVAPTELTPEAIRSVDAYLIALSKAIETHHAACLNIR
jgi:hypothetical protein